MLFSKKRVNNTLKKSKSITNWRYNVLESTPIIHPGWMLDDMYNSAQNRDQKSSILYHISNFGLEDHPEYKSIADKIWDDFR